MATTGRGSGSLVEDRSRTSKVLRRTSSFKVTEEPVLFVTKVSLMWSACTAESMDSRHKAVNVHRLGCGNDLATDGHS